MIFRDIIVQPLLVFYFSSLLIWSFVSLPIMIMFWFDITYAKKTKNGNIIFQCPRLPIYTLFKSMFIIFSENLR